MKIFSFFIYLIFISANTFGQENLTLKKNVKKADSLFQLGYTDEAKLIYLEAAQKSDFSIKKANLYFEVSRCFIIDGQKDSAMVYLKKAVKLGYYDKQRLIDDSVMILLKEHPDWNGMIKKIANEKVLHKDPDQSNFITADLHRFWKAYDKAYRDTANFDAIFKKYYFDKATRGMNDYMGLKVSTIHSFTTHIRASPKLYASVRKNICMVDGYKREFIRTFQTLKDVYPDAQFPNVYFVIGGFTSAGTVSNAGLLIGINQISMDDQTCLDELNFGQKTIMSEFIYLPNIIAHELIHFQQDKIVSDTTTLGYAIVEGMADFLGEIISGRAANPKLFTWAKGKEKTIWENFKKDMYLNRYYNWIANAAQGTPDNLPDQGYWVGYQICKSYYENKIDKRRAIADMLRIKDFHEFFEDSGWEEKVNQLH